MRVVGLGAIAVDGNCGRVGFDGIRWLFENQNEIELYIHSIHTASGRCLERPKCEEECHGN